MRVRIVRTNPATGEQIEVLRADGLPTRVSFDEVPPGSETFSCTLSARETDY